MDMSLRQSEKSIYTCMRRGPVMIWKNFVKEVHSLNADANSVTMVDEVVISLNSFFMVRRRHR